MAERSPSTSWTSSKQRDNRRCYYCNREGHFAKECPKKERDRVEKLTCFGCGGSGHMKRDCPRLKVRNSAANSPRTNQQAKYSRSSTSTPSGTSKPVNAVQVASGTNDQRGNDHVWGKGYRLGSASDSTSTGAVSRLVKSYCSVAASDSDSTGEKRENQSGDVSGDQIDEKSINHSRRALGELHCNGDETSPQPSDHVPVEVDLPPIDVQSDSGINGTHQQESDDNRPNATKVCSATGNAAQNGQYSKHDSSPKEEPSVAVVKKQSSTTAAKQAPEKRKQSHFPPFIDTHCHLDYVFDRYHHHGTFSGFMNRLSYPTNFEGCISTFCDPAAFSSLGAWRELLSEPNVWGTFGIHPHNAKYYHTSGLEDKVLEGLQHPKCVAFGEIGLDYSNHSPSDPQTQKDILCHQLQLVVPFGKPVVLHCRDAEQDLFEILSQHLPRDWFIHLHCFTGEPRVAMQFLNEFPNLYLGVCGNVTNPRQINMKTMVCEAPLERLLIETDAPYHVPSNLPKAGWCRNSHPALAFYVAKEIARLRKEDLIDILKTVRTNTRTLYGV